MSLLVNPFRERNGFRSTSPQLHPPDPSPHAIPLPSHMLGAVLGGDLPALMEVLASDVVLFTDGGGLVQAALRPIRGSDKVGRLLFTLAGPTRTSPPRAAGSWSSTLSATR